MKNKKTIQSVFETRAKRMADNASIGSLSGKQTADREVKLFPSYTIKSSVGIWIASIYFVKSGVLYCKVNGETRQEADTNAKRIVECVNAMAGIKNTAEWMKAVRNMAGADMVLGEKMFDAVSALQKQNEELMDAIKVLTEEVEKRGSTTVTKDSFLHSIFSNLLKQAEKK